MTMNTTTQRIFLNEETTWITADPHFGHEKIREFSNRPFENIEHMDSVMEENLKACVGANDTLIVVGDLTWNRKNDNDVRALPGKHKILVRGNHEKPAITESKGWTRACDYLEVKFGMADDTRKAAVICHYPMVSWNGARTSFHLHGHTHGCVPPKPTEFGGRMDVGVDVWNFKPVRLRDVISRLEVLRKEGFALPGKDY